MGRFRSSLVLKRQTVNRLGRLMNMEYKPKELAEELDVPADTVYRSWIGGGCPCRKDARGNVWINGTAFRIWMLKEVEKHKQKVFRLADEEAWCVTCDSTTIMINPHRRRIKRNLTLIQGECEHCGGTVNRLERAKDDDKP